ncbi:CBS domain-containing protein [Streptomyces luteireticuli]|uniref:CBS domain-containing protein n=1 Tax=Streptomyces luteireticuli TaxID=173858 RepID=A0ABN0YZQ3_9ACTN
MKHQLISQVMTTEVVTVEPRTPLKEIARTLARHGIGGVPVVEPDNTVLGMVTESDLVLRNVAHEERASWHRGMRGKHRNQHRHGRDNGARTAGMLMSAPAAVIGPKRTVVDAANMMADSGVGRLPVVDDEGRLVGIVTRRDVLGVLRRPDADVRADVIDEVVVRALWLAPHLVGVEVRDGVVMLSGTLERRSDAAAAVRLSGQVDGVVAVVDKLRYREDDSHRPPAERALRGVSEEWLRGL